MPFRVNDRIGEPAAQRQDPGIGRAEGHRLRPRAPLAPGQPADRAPGRGLGLDQDRPFPDLVGGGPVLRPLRVPDHPEPLPGLAEGRLGRTLHSRKGVQAGSRLCPPARRRRAPDGMGRPLPRRLGLREAPGPRWKPALGLPLLFPELVPDPQARPAAPGVGVPVGDLVPRRRDRVLRGKPPSLPLLPRPASAAGPHGRRGGRRPLPVLHLRGISVSRNLRLDPPAGENGRIRRGGLRRALARAAVVARGGDQDAAGDKGVLGRPPGARRRPGPQRGPVRREGAGAVQLRLLRALLRAHPGHHPPDCRQPRACVAPPRSPGGPGDHLLRRLSLPQALPHALRQRDAPVRHLPDVRERGGVSPGGAGPPHPVRGVRVGVH